jgi:hypothetical protein
MFHFRDVSADTDFATFKAHQLADPDECNGRTDSDRYAELRKLVEAWQSHITGSSQALADWSHR